MEAFQAKDIQKIIGIPKHRYEYLLCAKSSRQSAPVIF